MCVERGSLGLVSQVTARSLNEDNPLALKEASDRVMGSGNNCTTEILAADVIVVGPNNNNIRGNQKENEGRRETEENTQNMTEQRSVLLRGTAPWLQT